MLVFKIFIWSDTSKSSMEKLLRALYITDRGTWRVQLDSSIVDDVKNFIEICGLSLIIYDGFAIRSSNSRNHIVFHMRKAFFCKTLELILRRYHKHLPDCIFV